jgi:hypothetical protein
MPARRNMPDITSNPNLTTLRPMTEPPDLPAAKAELPQAALSNVGRGDGNPDTDASEALGGLSHDYGQMAPINDGDKKALILTVGRS